MNEADNSPPLSSLNEDEKSSNMNDKNDKNGDGDSYDNNNLNDNAGAASSSEDIGSSVNGNSSTDPPSLPGSVSSSPPLSSINAFTSLQDLFANSPPSFAMKEPDLPPLHHAKNNKRKHQQDSRTDSDDPNAHSDNNNNSHLTSSTGGKDRMMLESPRDFSSLSVPPTPAVLGLSSPSLSPQHQSDNTLGLFSPEFPPPPPPPSHFPAPHEINIPLPPTTPHILPRHHLPLHSPPMPPPPPPHMLGIPPPPPPLPPPFLHLMDLPPPPPLPPHLLSSPHIHPPPPPPPPHLHHHMVGSPHHTSLNLLSPTQRHSSPQLLSSHSPHLHTLNRVTSPLLSGFHQPPASPPFLPSFTSDITGLPLHMGRSIHSLHQSPELPSHSSHSSPNLVSLRRSSDSPEVHNSDYSATSPTTSSDAEFSSSSPSQKQFLTTPKLSSGISPNLTSDNRKGIELTALPAPALKTSKQKADAKLKVDAERVKNVKEKGNKAAKQINSTSQKGKTISTSILNTSQKLAHPPPLTNLLAQIQNQGKSQLSHSLAGLALPFPPLPIPLLPPIHPSDIYPTAQKKRNYIRPHLPNSGNLQSKRMKMLNSEHEKMVDTVVNELIEKRKGYLTEKKLQEKELQQDSKETMELGEGQKSAVKGENENENESKDNSVLGLLDLVLGATDADPERTKAELERLIEEGGLDDESEEGSVGVNDEDGSGYERDENGDYVIEEIEEDREDDEEKLNNFHLQDKNSHSTSIDQSNSKSISITKSNSTISESKELESANGEPKVKVEFPSILPPQMKSALPPHTPLFPFGPSLQLQSAQLANMQRRAAQVPQFESEDDEDDMVTEDDEEEEQQQSAESITSKLKKKKKKKATPSSGNRKGRNQHTCKECGMETDSDRQLYTHISSVHNKWLCPHCQTEQADENALKQHILVHSRGRPHHCHFCGEGFMQSGHCKEHERIHTGEKPYVCLFPGCDRSFSRNSYLKQHARIHTGEKRFVCDKCGKGFRQSSTLKSHARIHTGEKPYQCKLCNKNFRHGNTRKAHMLADHGIDVTLPINSIWADTIKKENGSETTEKKEIEEGGGTSK